MEFLLGDCLEIMATMDPGSVDVVVTSPPYNLGVDYGLYDDRIPRDEYLAWLATWADAVHRVLSPRGSLFLNVGSKPSDPWVSLQAAQAVAGGMPGTRFHLQNTIHWVKSLALDPEHTSLDETLAVGHYKPINSGRFVNDCHEYVFHFTKGGDVPLDRLALGVPYQDKSNVTRWRAAAQDRRCRGNVWFLPYETIQRRAKDRPHPATFPPTLAEWCMRLHGLDRCGLVLDPFLGLGSSAVAAQRLGLDFVGIEIDPEYLRLAQERTATLRAS